MKLDPPVAQLIVDQTNDLLGTDVAVAEESGLLIAASDGRSVGLRSPAASEAIRLGAAVELAPSPNGAALEAEREGMSLPLTYDGRRIGAIIVHDALDRCRATARLIKVLAELLIYQNAIVQQLPQEKELKDRFIYDLLFKPIADPEQTIRQGQILGMDLTVPRAVILVDAREYILNGFKGDAELRTVERQLHVRRATQRLVRSIVHFFQLPTDTIIGYIGDGAFAVLKAIDRQSMASWMPGDPSAAWLSAEPLKRAAEDLLEVLLRETRSTITLGVGRHHPGLEGLARSYADARAAADLGCRIVGPNRVHALDSLGIAAFVGPADQQTKVDLARNLLGPLDEEPDALETLRVFFAEDCVQSEAAERLAIHRNTLSYRLDKIANLTGLDPRRLDQAIQLRLALILRDLS